MASKRQCVRVSVRGSDIILHNVGSDKYLSDIIKTFAKPMYQNAKIHMKENWSDDYGYLQEHTIPDHGPKFCEKFPKDFKFIPVMGYMDVQNWAPDRHRTNHK